MARGEQLDKISKKYVRIDAESARFAKREHRRYLRRKMKDINSPNPMPNRYRGFIG